MKEEEEGVSEREKFIRLNYYAVKYIFFSFPYINHNQCFSSLLKIFNCFSYVRKFPELILFESTEICIKTIPWIYDAKIFEFIYFIIFIFLQLVQISQVDLKHSYVLYSSKNTLFLYMHKKHSNAILRCATKCTHPIFIQ